MGQSHSEVRIRFRIGIVETMREQWKLNCEPLTTNINRWMQKCATRNGNYAASTIMVMGKLTENERPILGMRKFHWWIPLTHQSSRPPVSQSVNSIKLTSISITCNYELFCPHLADRPCNCKYLLRVERVIYMRNAFIRSQLWNVCNNVELIIVSLSDTPHNCNFSLLNTFVWIHFMGNTWSRRREYMASAVKRILCPRSGLQWVRERVHNRFNTRRSHTFAFGTTMPGSLAGRAALQLCCFS